MFEPYREYQEAFCKPLSTIFGVEFGLTTTGGGCMALEATLEGGRYVWVTDADEVLSTMARRRECAAAASPCGFSAGVYLDGERWTGEPVGYAASQTACTVEDVAELIRAAVAEAAVGQRKTT